MKGYFAISIEGAALKSAALKSAALKSAKWA
jgi:hypothetical protein